MAEGLRQNRLADAAHAFERGEGNAGAGTIGDDGVAQAGESVRPLHVIARQRRSGDVGGAELGAQRDGVPAQAKVFEQELELRRLRLGTGKVAVLLCLEMQRNIAAPLGEQGNDAFPLAEGTELLGGGGPAATAL